MVKGNLVYEPLSAKYWISEAIVGLSAGPNPSYQLAYGTLDEVLNAYANDGVTDLRIKAVGFSLGPGAIGDGIVNSITAGCTSYTFTTTPVSIDAQPSAASCTNTADTEFTSWILVHVNEGVVYKIGDTVVTHAYTEVAPNVAYHVTAEAAPGFTLVGADVHEWTLTPTSTNDCQLVDLPVVTPVVTQTAATCSTCGSYTLAVAESTLADHVTWTVDGKSVAAGTYTVPAGTTVHVVVTAIRVPVSTPAPRMSQYRSRRSRGHSRSRHQPPRVLS